MRCDLEPGLATLKKPPKSHNGTPDLLLIGDPQNTDRNEGRDPLLDAGYGIHEVAERLGDDPGTLMRCYTRVNAARRRQAADHIAGELVGWAVFLIAVAALAAGLGYHP
jgi:hypothetical protein